MTVEQILKYAQQAVRHQSKTCHASNNSSLWRVLRIRYANLCDLPLLSYIDLGAGSQFRQAEIKTQHNSLEVYQQAYKRESISCKGLLDARFRGHDKPSRCRIQSGSGHNKVLLQHTGR